MATDVLEGLRFAGSGEVVLVPRDLVELVLAFQARYRQLERMEAEWRSQAACASRTVPPLRLHFPDPSHTPLGAKKVRRARRICSGCPVRRPCLEVAVDGNLAGVWGGTTDDQREATRGMEREARLEALEAMAADAATDGPWRVASEQEWGLGRAG